MKRFSFTLQRILGFKRTLYEKERNELARLRALRLQTLEHKEDVQNQMALREQDFREKAREGVGREEISSLQVYRNSTDYLVKHLEEEIAKLDEAIAKQLQVVIELDRDVKGLEKLREKQLEEYQLEAAREERERILELVSTDHLNNQIQQQREDEAASAS